MVLHRVGPWSFTGWGPHHLVSSTLSMRHLLRSSAILSHSWLFNSALLKSLLTLSLLLNLGLPLLLLPSSSVFPALFVNLSSLVLCKCPAHCSLLSVLRPSYLLQGLNQTHEISCTLPSSHTLLLVSCPSQSAPHYLHHQVFLHSDLFS